MKNKYYLLVIFFAVLTIGCKNNGKEKQTEHDSNPQSEGIKETHVEKSSTFVDEATKETQKLISENRYTPFDVLQKQKLDRIEENSEVLVEISKPVKKTGNELYYHLKERTMLIGSSYLCERCPNVHLNTASGFIIHEDGVMVTNYHVIEVKEGLDISAIFAIDYEGNAYPVSKILAASQSNDLAILQLDTNGKKLKTLPVAETELMGEDVYMMGHPFGNTFFMSKGIIAKKYINERDGEPRMAITAEFGQGASGGPVVNEYGQVAGIVSATYMHYTNGSKQHGDLQLVVKEAIPVSVLNNYVKRN